MKICALGGGGAAPSHGLGALRGCPTDGLGLLPMGLSCSLAFLCGR